MDIAGNEKNVANVDKKNSDPPLLKKNRKFCIYPFPIVTFGCKKNEKDPNWKITEGYVEDKHVLVHDEESMERFYCMGYFGKGTLSKYGPKICFEEMTVKQKQEAISNSPVNDLIDVVDSDDEVSKSETLKASNEDEVSTSDLSDKNVLLKDKASYSEEKESLQLTFQEAFFLCYGLGCLVVKDEEKMLNITALWKYICARKSNFPVMYTAYHHLRSKGYIVKNGLEFGTDYVLYEDGPPFCKPTYSVLVREIRENLREIKGNNKELTWATLFRLLALNKPAGLKLLILYVLKPLGTTDSFYETPSCIPRLKIEEVLHEQLDLEQIRDEEEAEDRQGEGSGNANMSHQLQ